MIRHIVFFSAKNASDIPHIKKTLLGYRAIPSVLKLEVTENQKCDTLNNEVDLVLYAEFASPEALAAYKQHPLYLAGIDVVRGLRDKRYAADITAL